MRIVKLYEEFKQNINKSKIDYIFDIVLDGLKNNISMKKTLFNLKNDNIVSNDFTEYFFRNLTDEQKKIINKYNIQMSKDYISPLNGEDVGPEYTGKILSDVDKSKPSINVKMDNKEESENIFSNKPNIEIDTSVQKEKVEIEPKYSSDDELDKIMKKLSSMSNDEEDNYTIIKIIFKTTDNKQKLHIISDLYKLEGIKKVYEEN
jgi:hypothetical protein